MTIDVQKGMRNQMCLYEALNNVRKKSINYFKKKKKVQVWRMDEVESASDIFFTLHTRRTSLNDQQFLKMHFEFFK